MIRTAFITLLLPFFLSLNVEAQTIKTKHSGVNLWSKAGRNNADKTGKIEPFEEIEVLDSRKLKNGETWLKVRLDRSPGWRKKSQTGWVDAKYFYKIADNDNDDDEVTEGSSKETCKNCLNSSNKNSHDTKNLRELGKTSKEISKAVPQKSRQGFIWPVKGVIKSGFGKRRHPIFGGTRFHSGTDIAGNNGKPVLAAKAGIVVTAKGGCRIGRKRCNGGAGNMVVIDHGDGTKTKYFHLNSNCPLPKSGTRVQQGQQIACVGSTGASTGPHLHLSVVINGKYVNPLSVLPKRN